LIEIEFVLFLLDSTAFISIIIISGLWCWTHRDWVAWHLICEMVGLKMRVSQRRWSN